MRWSERVVYYDFNISAEKKTFFFARDFFCSSLDEISNGTSGALWDGDLPLGRRGAGGGDQWHGKEGLPLSLLIFYINNEKY